MLSGFANLLGSTGVAQPQQQARPSVVALGLPMSLSQARPSMRNPSKYNQILQAVQKRKQMFKGGRVGYADGSSPQISQQQIAMIEIGRAHV